MATTAKKGKGKIIALFLALIIIAGAVVAFVLLNNKKATAVMECNVNPNIQFVLDQNNRVLRVNYLNEDAEAIFKEVNFNGKSADEAAQLFVELSTKAGFIDVKTTGTRVDITLSCETPDNYKDLEQKITINRKIKFIGNLENSAHVATSEINNEIYSLIFTNHQTYLVKRNVPNYISSYGAKLEERLFFQRKSNCIQ